MGGIVCQMIVKSKLSFTAVPTEPSDIQLFDNQMRDIHFNTEYSQSVINETEYAEAIVTILSKPSAQWTTLDRQTLLNAVNEVCGEYS